MNITKDDIRQQQKIKHAHACLLEESQYEKSAGFDRFELINQTAAGLSLNDISLATKFLGFAIKAPLMIAPMTGGMELGAVLNRRWAKAAEKFGIPFGVGSQRLACENKELQSSFNIRNLAPNILLFANLGAGQLRQSHGLAYALKAVEMIEADALLLHINPLQEACQKGGDVNFTGLLDAIKNTVDILGKKNIPVLAREVGFGFSESAARDLIAAGVSGLDCAGAGGTSWAKVEGICASDEKYQRLGRLFGEWGIKTVDSILNVRKASKEIPLIATGGIRTGVDVAKAIGLGADVAAMARPMLKAAIDGEDELFDFIEQILCELRIALFAAGAKSVENLGDALESRSKTSPCFT